jgi:uncharacterized membrane protein YfhO
VDGRSAPVGIADGLFKSVRVSGGVHAVTLTYRPLGFRLGVFLAAVATAGLFGVGVARRQRPTLA